MVLVCAAQLERVAAKVEQHDDNVRGLVKSTQGAMTMAVKAMARVEGLARLVHPPTTVPVDVPRGLEKQATASLDADRAFDDATEIRLDEHGQLLPVDTDAVLAAAARVENTTSAFFDAALSVEEPHIEEALDNAWRRLLFITFNTSETEAARPLSSTEMLCIQEMLRSAELHVSVERQENAFSMLLKWIELYARDAVVKSSQKCPENMLVRLQYYVQAPYPQDPWTPSMAVQAWRKLVGRPTSPAVTSGESNG